MRLILTTTLASLLATPALADTMQHCGAAWSAMPPADKAKTTYKAYSSMCLKKDYKVTTSATDIAPAGATAKCKDGTYSMSKTAQGQCSSHGGVESKMTGKIPPNGPGPGG